MRHLLLSSIRRNVRHPSRLVNGIGVKLAQRTLPERMFAAPFTVDIEPTVRCNLACVMCQLSTWDRRAEDLSLEAFGGLLDTMPMLTTVKLQGMGEPLLNRDFAGMVRLAAGRGIDVVTTSNGTLLSDRACEEIVSSGLAEISVSIDGSQPGTFESIRRNASFEKVTGGVRRLVTARGASDRPRIRVWMVAMRNNIAEAAGLVALCRELGVDDLAIQLDVSCWGKEEWLGTSRSLDSRGEAGWKGHVEEAAALASRSGIPLSIIEEYRFSARRGAPCMWPWTSLYVTAEGRVCPCCIACDPRVISFGDLREESLEAIWNGEKYRRFRRGIKAGTIPGFCRGCYEDFRSIEELD